MVSARSDLEPGPVPLSLPLRWSLRNTSVRSRAVSVCWNYLRPRSQKREICFPLAGVPAACFMSGVLSDQRNSNILRRLVSR